MPLYVWIPIGLLTLAIVALAAYGIRDSRPPQDSYSSRAPMTIDDLVRERDQHEQREREGQETYERKRKLEYEEGWRNYEAEIAVKVSKIAQAAGYFRSSEVEQLNQMLRDLYSKGLAKHPPEFSEPLYEPYGSMSLIIDDSEGRTTTIWDTIDITVDSDGTIKFEGEYTRIVPYEQWANNTQRLESELVYAYKNPKHHSSKIIESADPG